MSKPQGQIWWSCSECYRDFYPSMKKFERVVTCTKCRALKKVNTDNSSIFETLEKA